MKKLHEVTMAKLNPDQTRQLELFNLVLTEGKVAAVCKDDQQLVDDLTHTLKSMANVIRKLNDLLLSTGMPLDDIGLHIFTPPASGKD